MGKTGKISVIKKDVSTAFPTMEKSLRENKLTMFPGCKKVFMPAKLPDGEYLTGLNEKSQRIKNIAKIDPDMAQKEVDKILETKEWLTERLGNIDLSPRSDFWSASKNPEIITYLIDGDNFFDLNDPMKCIKYHYLKEYPSIAPSLEAWERGDCHSDTHFYVNDEDYESEMVFKRKKPINDAIRVFDSFSIDKQRKVLNLLGELVSEDTKPTVLYNVFDDYIRANEVKIGPYKGQSPTAVFEMFSSIGDEHLQVKHMIKEIFDNQIYRVKAGRVYEGQLEMFKSEDELFEKLVDEDFQDLKLELEKKLKMKKLAKV